MGNLKDIWVFIEMSAQQPKRSSLEIFAKAQKIAAEAGAEAVPVLCPADGDFSAVEIAEAMKMRSKKETPGAVLFASTPLGKDISAILSADMNLGIASTVPMSCPGMKIWIYFLFVQPLTENSGLPFL